MIVINEQEFRRFSDYIKANYGIYFKDEKKGLIEGRLGPLIKGLNFSSLTEYIDYVTADKTGKAASVMLNKITTNHTFFMRESAHFDYFRDVVLPYLTKTVRNKDLRIWSAACSSGEEPFTLAMIIDEFFGLNKPAWDTKILASDISQNVIDIAKSGAYSTEKMKDIPESWKNKYFKKSENDQYVVSDKIKNEVIFHRMNLMDSVYPFKKKMHVIFCRNVMIYFDSATKDKLVEHLYEITEPGGFLFIGHSESLNRDKMKYRYIMPAVYRKE
ncbi:MAG: protein-glutamate O-methyltransferase CheR [Eubacteriales bacterium]|nr:protein-glutamate O-methyltransferase CheR [Eubacteriales bacterium]